MASKKVLLPPGIKSLRRFIQQNAGTLMRSPVLVVSSEPAYQESGLSSVDESCKLVQFTLAQQFGLRTVSSTVSSAFPTLQDVEQRIELVRRTGASSVVAVGSGAAMDLGKALASAISLDQMILVPSTYGAVMASSSSHSLFLNPAEETLVPVPSLNSEPQTSDASKKTIAPLDAKLIAPADNSYVLFASLVFLLDACHRKSDNPLLEETLLLIEKYLFEESDQALSHEDAMTLLHRSGEISSFGLESENRSIPVAMASSLIPQIFPHVHILTFFASLLPGMCHAVDTNQYESADRIRTRLSDIEAAIPRLHVTDEELSGFSVPDLAMSHFQTNQALWKSLDVPDRTLISILQQSLS